MKVRLKQSVLEQVEACIHENGADNIRFIEFTETEYIQFIEELMQTQEGAMRRIVLNQNERVYKDVPIKIKY